MKRQLKLLPLLFIVMVADASENNPDWQRSCVSGSLSWTMEVPQSVIDSAPAWNPTDGECPLSPVAAFRAAVAAFNKLGIGEPSFERMNFTVSGMGPFAKPHYDVSLTTTEGGSVHFLVFLNGTVVSPTIKTKQS